MAQTTYVKSMQTIAEVEAATNSAIHHILLTQLGMKSGICIYGEELVKSIYRDMIPSWFRVSGNRKPMRLWTQRSIQRIQMVKASPASVLRPNRKIETVEPFAKYEYTIQKRIHYKYYIISLLCCYTEMNSKRRVFCRTLFSCFLLIFLYFMGCVHSPTPCYGMCLLALSVPRRR